MRGVQRAEDSSEDTASVLRWASKAWSRNVVYGTMRTYHENKKLMMMTQIDSIVTRDRP